MEANYILPPRAGSGFLITPRSPQGELVLLAGVAGNTELRLRNNFFNKASEPSPIFWSEQGVKVTENIDPSVPGRDRGVLCVLPHITSL